MTVTRGKSAARLRLRAACAGILAEIQPASVRAVCYKLFTQGLIASMRKTDTNKVSDELRQAREAGDIPWAWVVDETREAETVPAWHDPAAYARATIRDYRLDRWEQQPVRIEVWSEKGTVRGALAPVLNAYGVTFRVMHGYASATAVNDVAEGTSRRGKPTAIFYVGDYDPSGLQMSEVDLSRRLDEYGAQQLSMTRIALTQEDTLAGLPSFAAWDKRGDSRDRWFVQNYGERCWELDAMDPNTLRGRVEQAIQEMIIWEAWERCELAEAATVESLTTVMGEWVRILQPNPG